MSTRAAIALNIGGTYQTIYCHQDGMPERMLPTLRDNYNSFDLANRLISYGDASSIKAKLEPSSKAAHTFNSSEPDVCVFYHRDRGEDWFSCQPVTYYGKELFRRMDIDFAYIFEDEHWNVYNKHGGKINK